jgi:hypothetical protein
MPEYAQDRPDEGRGSSGIDEHTVEVPAHHCTLRELLEVLVRHELSEYEQRREANRTLRILTPTDLIRGVETGSYARERRAVPKAPPVEEAHARAVADRRPSAGSGRFGAAGVLTREARPRPRCRRADPHHARGGRW